VGAWGHLFQASGEQSSLASFFRYATGVTSRLALVVLALAACSKDSGGTGSGSGATVASASGSAGSAAKKGGFAASLSAEMAKEGSGSAGITGPVGLAGSAAALAGSATTVAAGSSTTTSISPSAGTNAGSNRTNAGSNQMTKATPPATGSNAGAVAVAPPSPPRPPPVTRAPAQVPADLAAIKMDLEPNWDRDLGEAGTISFTLKVPNSNDTRLFSFHYGYDPAGAPNDRDQYMTWLGDQKLLAVTLNRQRGAAWYLEGTDGNGAPAFRYLVMYGGKHLVCWGTLYKDAASNPLGDLRDKVVMAAKKICETMTL
jgi:hypothetical protein